MISRRNMLAAGAIASAAATIPVCAIRDRGNRTTVVDSRFAGSREFAAARRGLIIDVAQNPITLWSALRQIPTEASVVGLTRWSDFIAVRGPLESLGLRVRHFKQKGELIDWAMS
jgi:hypothetical protein